jgi:hypothetical protein
VVRPRTADPQVKKQREKGKGKKVEGKRGGKGKTREKQRWLGGVITSDMRDSSCANIDVNIDLLVG